MKSSFRGVAIYVINLMGIVGLGLGGCGGTDLDPGSGNDPGSGTQTLQIDGNVTAEARLSNAQATGEFDTEFSVQVTLNSVEVTTGTVELTSQTGTVTLAYDPNANNGNGGRWRGTAAGYDEVYVLDVVSGDDNVTGVRVDGPDIHAFTAPLAGATVDSTMPLDIAWSRDDVADSASIKAEQIDALAIADTGTYTLAQGALKAEADKPKENQLRLVRTNRVTPAGAAGGSQLSVSVRNELNVIAQANPAL